MEFSCASKHLCGMPGAPLTAHHIQWCIHCRGPIHPGGLCGVNLLDNISLINTSRLNPLSTRNERESGQPNICHTCFNDLGNVAVGELASYAVLPSQVGVSVKEYASGMENMLQTQRRINDKFGTTTTTTNTGTGATNIMGGQHREFTTAGDIDTTGTNITMESGTIPNATTQNNTQTTTTKTNTHKKNSTRKHNKVTTAKTRKAKKFYSLTQKLAILEEVDRKHESQEAIAARLGTTRKSIAMWKKDREKMKRQVSEEGRGQMSRMHSDGLKRIKDELKAFKDLNDNMPEDLKITITGAIISTKAKVIRSKLLEAHAQTPFLTPLEVKDMTQFRASEPWAYKVSKALGWKREQSSHDDGDDEGDNDNDDDDEEASDKNSQPESSMHELLCTAAENLGRSGRDVDDFVARLEEDWFNEAEQLKNRSVECLSRYMPLRLAEEVHRLVEAVYVTTTCHGKELL